MAETSLDLSGKVALITGGTGVLGSVMTKGLASAEPTVAILARTEAKTRALAAEIQESGGRAMGIQADVLDQTSIQRAMDSVLESYGRVDILLNGAGGNRSDATAVPGERSFFDLSPEVLRWVFDLNFTGSVLVSQIVGKQMAQQNSGVILNISSMASFRPMTRVIAYAGAKAAINNFTQWLAVYMATEHSPAIRVNAMAPGFFIGDQNRYLLIDEKTGGLTPRGETIINHTPMRRFGEADDLVGTMLWLVSDASRFVTGVVVPVDGGFSAFGGV